ncbi:MULTISPECIES: hypothetical protein [Amycolatopsis]|uniref:Uncharacterized protein n=1 Tax=Amycolatopsis dendrobii TaxID=2760662 RepID=A0A7W3W273_9PSEU|nr:MULTISPECIES: hypothetical protein [Amycolatopsis]MBB1156977.1 hypothetical protein [Amycolatopsis dendrobii]UKD53685.1 hypothetical protein L3Q65_38245 [Amycolatopsis sp. FU40]
MVSEDDENTEAVRALFAQAPDGPPMRVDAADVIVRGAAIRRKRKRWAVAGSSAATIAVLVAAGLAVGSRATEQPPVMPAGPGLATVSPAPSSPAGPMKTPADPAPGPAVSPGSPDKQPPTEPAAQRTGTARPAQPPRAHPTTSERAPASMRSPAGTASLPSPTSG